MFSLHWVKSAVVEVGLVDVLVFEVDDVLDALEGGVEPPLVVPILLVAGDGVKLGVEIDTLGVPLLGFAPLDDVAVGPMVIVLNDDAVDAESDPVELGADVIVGTWFKPFVSEPEPSPTVTMDACVGTAIAGWLDWDGRVRRTHRTTAAAIINTAMTPEINAMVVFDMRLVLYLRTPM